MKKSIKINPFRKNESTEIVLCIKESNGFTLGKKYILMTFLSFGGLYRSLINDSNISGLYGDEFCSSHFRSIEDIRDSKLDHILS